MSTPSTHQENLSPTSDRARARELMEPDVSAIVNHTLELIRQRSNAGCFSPSQNPNFRNAARFMLAEVIDRLHEQLEFDLV